MLDARFRSVQVTAIMSMTIGMQGHEGLVSITIIKGIPKQQQSMNTGILTMESYISQAEGSYLLGIKCSAMLT